MSINIRNLNTMCLGCNTKAWVITS